MAVTKVHYLQVQPNAEVAAKRCEEDGKRVGHFSHRFL